MNPSNLLSGGAFRRKGSHSHHGTCSPLRSQRAPISEIDVLWITAGLGCDGDTIAMTAATQPSIEDIVLGALPWIPKVHFYNPFLASDNRRGFHGPFPSRGERKVEPFHPRHGGLDSR